MKDKFFIDTNIFVYTFSPGYPDKMEKSRAIVREAHTHGHGCISYQVVQEFFNVALKKFTAPLSPSDCEKYLDAVLAPLCEIYAGPGLFHKALNVYERWKFSFYDALIVAAALNTNCDILYSEDLQHQQAVETMTIINPFV